VMLGGSYIQIAPGGSLKLYVGGGSAKLTTVNTDGNANTFQYYGLPANTSLEWGGNAEYVGTIYAPKAAFTLGGGGNNVYDFQGACMVWSVVMNGHFKFHYDENLAKNGPLRGYIVTDWREL
jgi:hypothetical protein